MILGKLQKLRPREKTGLSIAMLCVLGLLADRLVIRSVVNRFKLLDDEIEHAEDSLAFNMRVLDREDRISEKYENIRSLLGKTSSPAAAIDNIKGKIDELARQTGVVLVSMEHREPRKSEFYAEYLVEIGKFETEMKGLLRFLHELRKSSGMLTVARLNLSPVKGKNLVEGSILMTKVMLPVDETVGQLR